MGFSKKASPEEWIIAGISIRTKPKPELAREEGEKGDFSPRTPTARESRIPERLPCPPAPMKRRPVQQQRFHFDGAVEISIRDLESMFVPISRHG